ncbi:MAG TPA: hypothetical protein VF875_11570 [Anaeromyxobacter sp.]
MSARILAAAAVSILLAACGSKSTADAPFVPDVRYPGATVDAALTTSSDRVAIAGVAASIAQGFDGSAITGSVSMSGIAVAAGAGIPNRPATVRGALLLAQDSLARRDLATVAGAYATASATCPGGGSVSFAASQASATVTTVGDYIQISFSACNDGYGSVAFGSVKMTIEETTGAEFVADATSITSDTAFGLSLVFHDFAATNPDGSWSGVDGDLEVAFLATVEGVGQGGTMQFQVSGASLVAAGGPSIGAISEATRLTALPGDLTFHELGRELYTGMGTFDATRTESQWDVDAKVCSLAFAGCLDILTDPTFAKHELHPYPYVGAIEVSDGAGHYIKVTAVDEDTGAATLAWDVDGTPSTVSTTWGCLDGTAICPP